MGEIKLRPIAEAIEEARQRDPLKAFFVWWDEIESKQVDDFSAALEDARNERDIQAYLESHPILLVQAWHGGHGRWVIPQKRLGCDYVTDFLMAEKDSMGFHWTAVELESPLGQPFNKNGDPSAILTHAIRQITDWRGWLVRNQNYASRLKNDGGLSLTEIEPNLPGLILIGRQRDIDPNTNSLRRNLGTQMNIAIHSYDWLVREAQGRVCALANHRSQSHNS